MQWVINEPWLTRLGILLFFLVPIILWFIGIAFVRRTYVWDKIFVFVAGNDNRLSLSRLQAFLWTLVIFGSFFAAMAIHTEIKPTTPEEEREYKTKAETAANTAIARKTIKEDAEKEKLAAESNSQIANRTAFDKQVIANTFTSSNTTTPEAKKALDEAASSNLNAKAAEAIKNNREQLATEAEAQVEKADKESVAAANEVAGFDWVDIPAALLALAGIAIGSGVFSSLISALNDEEKTACVTSITYLPKEEFNDKTAYPDKAVSASDNLLKINGKGMDTTGKVRLGRGKKSVFLPILYWKSDGTTVVVDVPQTNTFYHTLVVDTPNGKLCYELTDSIPIALAQAQANVDALSIEKQARDKDLADAKAVLDKFNADANATTNDKQAANQAVDRAQSAVATEAEFIRQANDIITKIKNLPAGDVQRLALGVPVYYYEFSDLFRDDKNPGSMDLMKFQMFGWTIVAIFIYAWLFLSHLGNDISSLPLVPPSIVILTGLSQTGYLAGKGVSNVDSNKKQGT